MVAARNGARHITVQYILFPVAVAVGRGDQPSAERTKSPPWPDGGFVFRNARRVFGEREEEEEEEKPRFLFRSCLFCIRNEQFGDNNGAPEDNGEGRRTMHTTIGPK